MEVERQGDIRVPLIAAFFCLFVIAGGVLLVIYVCVPDQSQPWYPAVALALIGTPWLFWLITYIYTCMKAYVRARQMQSRQLSKRSSLRSGVNRTQSCSQSKNNGDDDDGKHVHFGEVVVMQDDAGQDKQSKEEISVGSQESTMPLTSSDAS